MTMFTFVETDVVTHLILSESIHARKCKHILFLENVTRDYVTLYYSC